MVSLWPWRGNSNSAESFERTLSALATKITKTTAQNDSLRQRARKIKVGWTLYAGFAYILAFLILTLVTGWRNWGAVEYTVVSGGPLLLYGVRKLLTLWYNYRISKNQEYLDSLNKERDGTIEKLKAATKYDSTQQLIDKYSSKPSTPKQTPGNGKKQPVSGKQDSQQQRVFVQPPPTANIPRGPISKPSSPAPQHHGSSTAQAMEPPPPHAVSLSPAVPPTAEFAPNAFSSSPMYTSPPAFGESRWYDRILDALLGEDETSSKNRFALICSQCRLVNGQAPPGAKSLEDVGVWRCSGCGAMNGEESEAAKLVKEVSESARATKTGPTTINMKQEVQAGEEFLESDGGSEGSPSPEKDADTTPARSTRSKSKGKKGPKKT